MMMKRLSPRLSVFAAAIAVVAIDARSPRLDAAPGPQGMARDQTALPAPAATEGTATIDGVVTSADLGRPVRRATVRMARATPGPAAVMTTDDQGRFHFDRVAAGTYTLTATKPGYLTSTYGEKRPGRGRAGTPLAVTDGARDLEREAFEARGGVIAGTVADDGGEPAFGVELRAMRYAWQNGERTLRQAGRAVTDDRGGYRIGALPPGDYIVIATPGDSALPIDALTTGASGFAAGRVVSEAAIMVRPTFLNGSPLGTVAGSMGAADVYFPGVTTPSGATVVSLDLTEERAGVDMQLPLVATGRITGTVTSVDGGSSAGTRVQLLDADQRLPGLGTRTTFVGPDGKFSFSQVPPGRYQLRAASGPQRQVFIEQPGPNQRVTMTFSSAIGEGPGRDLMPPPPPPSDASEARSLWAAAEVVLASGTQEVDLVLEPGLSVRGTVTFDGAATPPDLAALRVVLNPASSRDSVAGSSIAVVDKDGGFTLAGVAPGGYRVATLGSVNWRIKSFVVDGRDVMDTPLVIEPNRNLGGVLTLTTRISSLSGTLQTATGQTTADYTIVLFADDPQFWSPVSRRIQATRPATDGRFAFSNLPAGTYRLVAVDDLDDGQWFDPAILRTLTSGALQVAVGDGETKTQDIRVTR